MGAGGWWMKIGIVSVTGMILGAASVCLGATVNSFNGAGTAFALSNFGTGSPATVTLGSGPGMLVLAQGAGSENAAAFDETDNWDGGGVDATFSMQFNSAGSLEFGLLSDGDFGKSGPGPEMEPGTTADSFVLSIDTKAGRVSGGFNYPVVATTNAVAAAAQSVAEINAAVTNITNDLAKARANNDPIAVTTCSNLLSSANVALQSAKDQQSIVISTSAKGDNDTAQHSLQVIKTLAQSVQTYNTNSGQAVGRNSVTTSGEEEQTTPMPMGVPVDDDPDCEIHIVPTADGSGAEVIVNVVDPSGTINGIFDESFSNLVPYESRVEFDGATDGAGASVGIDDVDVEFNTVPEPTGLLAIGILGLGMRRRRRRWLTGRRGRRR
jgi:hypothetical protein